MADDALRSLRGLILSATELRQMHPDWTAAMIEDYLNIFNNLTSLANEIDSKSGLVKNAVLVTSASYTPISDDERIFCDTDFGAINIILPVGTNGAEYRVLNTGRSGNAVTITPDGTELLFGENNSFPLYDAEVVDICFEETQGWH